MNPENQNLNSPPSQPQPTPQVYGQQQYSPMPVPSGEAPMQTPPKSSKKLIIAVAVLAVLFLIVVAVAVLLNLKGNKTPGSQGITRAYDSPAGLVPGMQVAGVQSGKFKLRASYVTGGDFTREGAFSVEDGKMYFDMVPDDTRVNELMQYLHTRTGSTVPFDAKKHGVSRNLSYDFASMLGYNYLYDQNGGEFSGFILAVEAAKSAGKPDPRYTLTTTCDTALAAVKRHTNMTTTGLVFEQKAEGINKTQASVSFSTLQAVDKSVASFFNSCYDLNLPAAAGLKQFVAARRENVTKSPTFTYWQENDVNFLEISAPAKDTPFGGSFHFELTGLSASPVNHDGNSGSYVERRNQFGLSYSLCRIDPVVTTTQTVGYKFLREDPAYLYPNTSDTGYYCTTLSVPSQFVPVSSTLLKSTTGGSTQVTGPAVDGLRGHHDLVHQIEQYNISNKRYPGPTEFRDMANSNMAGLTSVTQAGFANKTLVYTPMPAGCVGTCNDFVLSFVPATSVQVQRTTYKP